jgi:hypothetical protein
LTSSHGSEARKNRVRGCRLRAVSFVLGMIRSCEGSEAMKFMIIVKASRSSEAGKMPSTELLAAMGRFNE